MIDSIKLHNFRNFVSLDFPLPSGLTLLYGDNAQGKTNLLEAINYLSTLKSYRAVNESDLIYWGQDQALLEGRRRSEILSIVIRSAKRDVKFNSITKKVWDVIGEFKTVIFSPEDVALVTGVPANRRRFLDVLIAKTNRTYVWDMLRLRDVLKNRNRVLFNIKSGRREDISPWNDQLAKLSIKVWKKRLNAIAFFNQSLKKTTADSRFPNLLKIRFETVNYPQFLKTILKSEDTTHFEEAFIVSLESLLDQEVNRGSTLLGPHRDDFYCLEVKREREVNLASYGSRGEQRSFVLALKISEVNFIESLTNERPTLLLDDILSELDSHHRDILFDFVDRQQTVMTSAELDIIPRGLKEMAAIYKVENGTLETISKDS